MSFSKARYVTVCQQMLVAASVLMLGVTAAGALTLDIVAPDAGAVPGARHDTAPVPGEVRIPAGKVKAPTRTEQPATSAPALSSPVRAEVASAPVRPQVRQVRLSAPKTPGKTPSSKTPSTTAPTTKKSVAPRKAAPETIAGLPVVLTSPAEKVQGFATVGAVWNHGVELAENAVAFEVRTQKDGAWSPWQRLEYHDDHGPDGAEGDATRDRPGTEPSVVGHVDAVQLRVAAASGVVPAGLEFSLIDPGTTKLAEKTAAIDTARLPASDSSTRGTPIESTADLPTTDPATTSSSAGDLSLSAMKVSPKPQIFSRAQWGADEKLREKGLPDYGTIKTGFVHHTVNANDYTKADVPAIIRSIYAYHVISRGWRDIGYNFLVDRFGRIWEGRYGGVDKPVTGAHTLGYNDVAFAMSAIGNFDIAKPPQAVVDAYAKLFAWKLSMYNISATASGLKIHGKTLHAINGHRDVGQTACPGKYLYARIPDIRTEAAKIQVAAQGYDPNQTPAAATAQPSSVKPGGVRTLLGRSRLADVTMMTSDGRLAVLPLGGLVGYGARITTRGSWAGAVPVGDVTGDGRGDVMTRGPGGRGWVIHAGTPGGKVAAKTTGSVLFASSTAVIPVRDWDHDGRADVLTITKTRDLVLHRGKGAGRFAAPQVLAKGWTYTRTVVGGDLDRSGRPELLIQDASGKRYRVPARTTTKLAARVPVAVSRTYTAYYGGGDMTGDGLADVWVRTKKGVGYLLPGNGKGGFGPRLGPFSGFEDLALRGLAPMAGGSRLDVVGVDRSGALVVRANNQQVNAARVIVARKVAHTPTQVLTVGDWNRDGKGDVVMRTDGGRSLYLFRGNGAGGFQAGVAMPGDWSRMSRLSAVGDITGDGRPDLVGRNAAGVLVVWPGDGVSGFGKPRKLPASVRTGNLVGGASWATGRFPASIAPSSDGSFVPLGGSTAARTIASASGADMSQYDWVIGAGDVNGDGHPDLLVRQRTSGTLWLIPGRTNGVGARVLVAPGFKSYRLGG